MNDLLITSLVGAVSGAIAALATLVAHFHGLFSIRQLERAREKRRLAHEAFAYRYVLQSGADADGESKHRFARAFNQIPIVFYDDEEVVSAYDRLVNQKTDANLESLIRELGKQAGLKREMLTSHIMRTITVGGDR